MLTKVDCSSVSWYDSILSGGGRDHRLIYKKCIMKRTKSKGKQPTPFQDWLNQDTDMIKRMNGGVNRMLEHTERYLAERAKLTEKMRQRGRDWMKECGDVRSVGVLISSFAGSDMARWRKLFTNSAPGRTLYMLMCGEESTTSYDEFLEQTGIPKGCLLPTEAQQFAEGALEIAMECDNALNEHWVRMELLRAPLYSEEMMADIFSLAAGAWIAGKHCKSVGFIIEKTDDGNKFARWGEFDDLEDCNVRLIAFLSGVMAHDQYRSIASGKTVSRLVGVSLDALDAIPDEQNLAYSDSGRVFCLPCYAFKGVRNFLRWNWLDIHALAMQIRNRCLNSPVGTKHSMLRDEIAACGLSGSSFEVALERHLKRGPVESK